MSSFSYSIIIPTKNTFDLLQKLIDSIPQRPDVQVIIVDDNSDPSLVDFEHFPGLERENTEVIITKKGKGAGTARNVGLEKAQGKWVLFSDSDDYFDTENLNYAFDKYKDSDADLVFFNANRVDEETGDVLSQHLSIQKYKQDTDYYINYLKYWSNVPWAKFIKKELITKYSIRFSEVPSANDLFFSTVSGYHANKVIVDFTTIYNWRVRTSGSITSNISEITLLSKLSEASKRNDFLWKKGEKKWCKNLYSTFYRDFRNIGYTTVHYLRTVKHYSICGNKCKWLLSFLLAAPITITTDTFRRLFKR